MPPRKRQTKRKLHGSQAQSVKLSQNEPKLIAEDPPLVPEKKRKVPQASGIDVMSISPTISGGTIKIVPKKVNRKKEVSNRSDGKGNSDVAVEILSQPPSSNTNLNDSNDGSSNNTSTDSSSSSLTIAELVQRQSNISTPVMDASDTGVENNVISNEEILIATITNSVAVLVCDADTSIHNGFKKVFSPNGGVDAESEVDDSDSDVDSAGSDNANNVAVQQQSMQHLIVMCYFHVTLNIQNKYKFKDAKNKAMFKDDVRMLHLCDNEKKFDIGCALFVKKWKRTEPEPTRLLQKSFFKKHRNWYIGVAPRIPKTNNHMETFNSTMKRCQTEHQRQPLKQFVQTALAIVRQRSKEYWKDKASFQHELLISDEIIAQGRELKRNYVYDTAKANGEMDFYMFRSGIHENITLPDVRVFYNETYETFDEFTAHGFDIYKITFPQETAKWQDALCTCPAYDTNYMCKHIISIANSLALLPSVEEEDYDDDPLFVSRRGRPKRTTKALVKEQ